MKKNYRLFEDAVSPVIGVLLMLVVTIIIAAVVSGFAGGLAGDTQKVPQASIQVKTGYGTNYYGDAIDKNNFGIYFEHLSGDPLPTKDIEIITYLTLPNGTVVTHKQNANSPFQNETTTGYTRVPFIRDQMLGNYYNTTAQIDAGGSNPCWFGVYTLMPGQVVRTYKKGVTAGFLGLVPESSLYPVNAADFAAGADLLEQCIQQGSQVDIKWLHKPSGKYILDTKINLQG
ncbi:hypothetical protein Mhun_0297 [Methanospirillum hungatei JF-1]|jgi:FlaG/FlaF family flagellin (archaellin)|uniref:Archaeal Type IV pilin N-terminal domain-containing protein n=1 Tax=Methanospirillum hungatei JF-1 (strain ATCC 27890 / DSM 864 / NBRC 100397 / JF-1) TaxID=323259 RepID=Q2FMY2_METHJ|nr:type IV pilin N-terminal domain-containing protein [Methanospirillum hungatei]ABD40068.1 hypothetical protein Mhun_0297 [Methanospirillum hungatei JF-1]